MDNKTKKNASDARSFIELNRLGVLSTHSVSQPGFPFGSIAPYDVDGSGALIVYLSLIAEHFKNLKANPLSSVLILDPFGVFDPQARARATVLTNFEPVPEAERAEVQARYEKRFPGSINYEIAHNFLFFRSQPLKVRWIGGFGDISWIRTENLLAAPFDDLSYNGLEIIEHMNEDHSDALLTLVQAHSDLAGAGARVQMVSINSEEFEIAVTKDGSQKRVTIPFPRRLEKAEDSRAAMIELLKDARQKLASRAS